MSQFTLWHFQVHALGMGLEMSLFFILKLLSEFLTATCNSDKKYFALSCEVTRSVWQGCTPEETKKDTKAPEPKKWLWDLGTSSMTALKLFVRINHQYFGKTLF